MVWDILVIGGGAAGFFAALSAKATFPNGRVALLEKSAVLLSKVRISGGGRCNVTNACFDPKHLAKNYPRGEKELIGPFHRFQPRDTMEWFQTRGVDLKIEADGRVFPVSNNSETIIQCLVEEAKIRGVEIFLKQRIESVEKSSEAFVVQIKDKDPFYAKKVILATGSGKEGYTWAKAFGHSIVPPVPSLFTFNVPSSPLLELSGRSFENVRISIFDTPFSQEGPLLLTHFGFSGPAALKLSAWAARYLFEKNYQVKLKVDWLPQKRSLTQELSQLKKKAPNRTLYLENPFHFPKKFWKAFLAHDKLLNDISLKELERLSERLHASVYQVEGKTTNKEEFVTCGGVCLKEVNFKEMESKLCPGLFFAGEILNIDGVTGGFNFQNAWTTGFIAGSS